VKVSNFFTKVNYPVLTDLQLDLAGVKTDLVYPRGIPDVFRGSQVTLIGRYNNPASLDAIRLKLSGKSGGAARTYAYDGLRFPLREDANDYLPRLWATRRVGWLMEQVRSNGEQKELRDEIVDLGTRYGIVTPYTSYLALEEAETTRNQFSNMPTSAPTRRAATGGLSTMAPGVAADASQTVRIMTGEEAVKQSKRAREQQQADSIKDEPLSSAVRRIAGKTFYLVDGVWTDSDFKADRTLPETTLTFGSDEYFALLKQTPKLADYFSLGERLVVVFEGRVYRVNAIGP